MKTLRPRKGGEHCFEREIAKGVRPRAHEIVPAGCGASRAETVASLSTTPLASGISAELRELRRALYIIARRARRRPKGSQCGV